MARRRLRNTCQLLRDHFRVSLSLRVQVAIRIETKPTAVPGSVCRSGWHFVGPDRQYRALVKASLVLIGFEEGPSLRCSANVRSFAGEGQSDVAVLIVVNVRKANLADELRP